MADLFALLRDLGEQIANKGDGNGSRPLDSEALEARFRSVLPYLLETYLVPFQGTNLMTPELLLQTYADFGRSFCKQSLSTKSFLN